VCGGLQREGVRLSRTGVSQVPGNRTGIPTNSISVTPDFLCYGKIILEIKAVSALVDEHRAQVLNYLSAAGCKLGLLVNFGHYPKLEYERLLPRQKESPDVCSLKF
jgi:GxxExxY protein